MTGLEEVLAVLRRRGHEPSWTQAIAAIARRDGRFASAFATLLIEAAPKCANGLDLHVPENLLCIAELAVRTKAGGDPGRVDLFLHDEGRTFALMVELKLHSAYGNDQLPHYMAALDAEPAPRSALVAITKTQPHIGEEAVAGDPRWLGSVRWASIYEQLLELPIKDASARAGWRAALGLVGFQRGDLGVLVGVGEIL